MKQFITNQTHTQRNPETLKPRAAQHLPLGGLEGVLRLFCALCLLLTLAINNAAAETVSITSFSATSGTIGNGFTYATYKGDAGTAPAVNNNQIRLYQGTSTNAGGLLVVSAPTGYTITQVEIKTAMATTVGYVEGEEYTTGQTQATMKANNKSAGVSKNGTYTASGLSCSVITFACLGTTSSSRLYLSAITVTYSSAPTCTTTPTFTIADKTISLNEASNIYDMSSGLSISKGGSTGEITYSCADEDNVMIDGSTFYTETAGSYTVTATMAAAGDYCEATTTFTITVTAKALDPLATPTGLSSSAVTATTVTLSWSAVANATGYRVTIGGNSYETTSTSYAATGLTAETAYSWTVTAIGDGETYGDSDESTASTFTTAALPKYTITWSSNGGAYDTSTVTQGEAVTLPSGTPTSCSATYATFVGWYTSAAGSESSPSTAAPATQVTAETVPTGDVTYYAVFAKETTSGGDGTLTINAASDTDPFFPTSDSSGYLSTDFEYNSITFGRTNAYKCNSGIQIKGGTSNCVYNKDPLPGAITSIKVTKKTNNCTLTVGTSSKPTTNSKTVSSTSTYIFDASANLKYFKIAATSSYTVVGEIVITYSSATTTYDGYISSCCSDAAVVTVTPAATEINLDASGQATTTVSYKQTGGGSGTGSYSVSPETATFDGTTFTATAAGVYTVTYTYTETCAKSGSATITVLATPVMNISQSGTLAIAAACGSSTTDQSVTVSGYNLTAGITVTSNNAAIAVATAADGTYGSSATYTATSGKVNTPIYIQVTAPAESTAAISGTLTISSTGATSQTLAVSATVTCVQKTITYNANGGSNPPAAVQCYVNASVTLPEQGSMTAPANKVFVGWNTDKTATTALASYTMPASDVTLYAIWRAANYTIACTQPEEITTQAGTAKTATATVTLNDQSSFAIGSVSGTNKDMFSVAKASDGSGIVVTFNPPTGTAEGTYTATVTLAGTQGGSCTVTLRGTVTTLAALAWENYGEAYCYDVDDFLEIPLDGALYKNGTLITTDADAFSNNVVLTDLSLGTTVTCTAISATSPAYVKFLKANMTLGHTYRLTFTNDSLLTNAGGTPYTGATCEFTIKNCSTITVLPACPIGTTAFTANWENTGDCTGTQTLNVYQKEEATLIDAKMPKVSGYTIEIDNIPYTGTYKVNSWLAYPVTGSYTTDANGVLLNASSTNVYVYTPQLGQMKDGVTIDENTELKVTAVAYNGRNSDAKKLGCIAINTEPANRKVTTDGIRVNFNGKSDTCWVSENITNTDTVSFTLSGVTSTTRLAFCVANYESSKELYLKSVTIKTLSKTNEQNISVSCSATEQAVSGLTAGQTYYYTLGGSAEQKVTLRSEAQEIDFDQAKLSIQSDDGVCATGTVPVAGTNVSACLDDISLALSGTNASLFSVDGSALTYNVTTGTLGGSVAVTYCPGTERGTHTATLTLTASGTDYTLDLEGTSCNNYTPNDPTTGATYAIANLGSAMNGTIKLTDLGNGKESVLNNGGFETDATTGWTSSLTGQFTKEQSTTKVHGGSYSLHITKNGDNKKMCGVGNLSNLYSNTMALDGDYTLSFYVYLPNSYQEEEFYYGLIDAKGNVLAYGYKEVTTRNQWLSLSANFSGVSGTYGVFIGRRTGSTENFYIDDVTLCKTSAGGEQTYSFSNTATPTMDNLWPGHKYNYSVVNGATGCEYGPFEFTTNDSTITPSITVESPLTISCQTGKTASSITVVETQWCTADVLIAKSSDNCENCNNCDNFTIDKTQLGSQGGTLKITFTPGSDVANLTRECNLVMTSGDVTDTLHLIGIVSAGSDPSEPLIEVVDIDTTMMTVEHNIEGTDKVEIVLNRELTEDEITKNVGYELFFSKYYEASSTVKLWAVYNPTNDTIDLTGTYVWIGSNGNNWSTKAMCDLSALGNYETGKIYPNEELIVYASDGRGAILNCARASTDMSSWFGLEPAGNYALSFDGNDALALMRSEKNPRYSGKLSDGTKQAWPYELQEGDNQLSWRYIDYPTFTFTAKGAAIAGSDTVRYQMLDLIGARKASNQPDNSKCSSPKFSATQSGDEAGWNSKIGKDMNGKTTGSASGTFDVLSTNRCLLVRSKEVKSGSEAAVTNLGDFYTLANEWQGANVPSASSDKEDAVSCENFAFVGGFDYANYYSSYTPLTDGSYTFVLNPVGDDTWITNDFVSLTDFTCKTLLIECAKYSNVGGVEVREVKASTEYKVPIIVNYNTNTTNKAKFGFTEDTCKVCDVVILSGKRLDHVANGHSQFRNVKTFPGGNFSVNAGQTFTVKNLEMQAKNDTVSFATVDGTLTVSDYLVHEKRIDSKNWYCFSLPYDCNMATIRQLNGKSLGTYGEDWWIQKYDGASRAETGTWNTEGTGYNGATYWEIFESANNTLEANQAYLIGIGGINEGNRLKTVYFPPVDSTKTYSESGEDTKTLAVQPYNGTASNRTETKYHNDRGWNFIGHPYISNFNQTKTSKGVNVDEVKMGYWTGSDYNQIDKVYVNLPIDGLQDYDQQLASSVVLEPFRGCFVQVAGDASATLTFEKKARELPVAAAPQLRSAAHELHAEVLLQIADTAGNSDITGILVDERYSDNYEVARDLVKMGSTKQIRRPLISTYITDGSQQKLAFNALPAASAKRIPMYIYTPKAGNYTIAIDRNQSNLSGVTAVTLYYGESVVANLLESDYTITASRRSTNSNYSITVERVAQVVTPIDQQTDGIAPIAYINNGVVQIDQLPVHGRLSVVDAVGRQLHTQPLDGSSTYTLQNMPAGVYMIVIDSDTQRYLLRTIVK